MATKKQLQRLKVAELRSQLESLGLSTDGTLVIRFDRVVCSLTFNASFAYNVIESERTSFVGF